jgi:hypothetical protein
MERKAFDEPLTGQARGGGLMEGSNRRIRRPSPAMVVALVALFVALSGTSYAMSQLAKNSVGTPQLKNNAVTTAKVKNGTLLSTDFKSGQLQPGPPGPVGPAGPKGDTGATGATGSGAALDFSADLGDAPKTTTSTTLSTVGSTTLTVPAGATATVVATFSAESLCRNGAATNTWCVVRLFIDGTEMNPEDGTNFAFDSPAASTALASLDYEAHSITRIRKGIGAGSHTITAQYQVFGTPTFRLDDWSLIAVAYKQ